MSPSKPSDTVEEAIADSPAQAAAEAMQAAKAAVQVTVGGNPGAALAPTVFDRLSVERRVLGHITDEIDVDAFGPRNTLHALTYGLVSDPNTVRPPATHPRLEVEGLSDEQAAQLVLDHLDRLVEAGLAAQRSDGSYEVTDAGRAELGS